jgi:hypothetical protein
LARPIGAPYYRAHPHIISVKIPRKKRKGEANQRESDGSKTKASSRHRGEWERSLSQLRLLYCFFYANTRSSAQ